MSTARMTIIAICVTVIGVALAIGAAYSFFSADIPTACPSYAPAGATTSWHEMYCVHAYLWVPRPPEQYAPLCDEAVSRRFNCIRLDDPGDPLQQQATGNVGAMNNWPWGLVDGAIVNEDMPRWQQVAEIAACGDNYARWPRQCYTDFTRTFWRVVGGFALVSFCCVFMGLSAIRETLHGDDYA